MSSNTAVQEVGLSWNEAMDVWEARGSTLRPEEGFLRVPNWFYDIFFPLLPKNDASTFMYLFRRTMGYHSNAAVISYEEFAGGRKRTDGKPLDFGCGLSESSVREALERLRAANIIILGRKSKGGRPIARGKSFVSQGSTWAINEDSSTWSLATYFVSMTYGQLGRYVQAATWGEIIPPKNKKELKALKNAIEQRKLSIENRDKDRDTVVPLINLPQAWEQALTNINRPNQHSYLTVPGDGTVKQTTVPGGGTVNETTVPGGGTVNRQFPRPDAEKNEAKETITNKETTSKETIPQNPALPDFAKGRKLTKESFDGRNPREWVQILTDKVYKDHGRDYPLTLKDQIRWIHRLRETYPVEVVAQYMVEKMKESYFVDKELTFYVVANNIGKWSGLKQAMRDWRKLQQLSNDNVREADNGRETNAVNGGSNGSTQGIVGHEIRGTDSAVKEIDSFAAELQAKLNAMARGEVPKMQ